MTKFSIISSPLKKKRKTSKFESKILKNDIIEHGSSNKIITNRNSMKCKTYKKNTYKPKKKFSFQRQKKFYKKVSRSLDKMLLNEKIDNNNEYIKKIKEFLSPSFDETDFDDVISLDKRTFWKYFCEKFQNNQIFINAFCIHEMLRPRSLKLLVLAITIELYFVINALFYNEEYLSALFNSKEEDTYFSFIPRRLNQYIYTSAVSGFISYLMGYFFIDEIKFRRIFTRNKADTMKLKYELSILINNINSRFIGLIISSISLSVICFVYICCFNIVYPYIREEWIKSSLFILILMQTLSFLITLLETCLRFMAIRCNSEKMFRLSLMLS